MHVKLTYSSNFQCHDHHTYYRKDFHMLLGVATVCTRSNSGFMLLSPSQQYFSNVGRTDGRTNGRTDNRMQSKIKGCNVEWF